MQAYKLLNQPMASFSAKNQKEGDKKQAQKEEKKEEVKKKEEKKEETKKKDPIDASSSSSSDEEGNAQLSKEDIQKIKALLSDQETQIDALNDKVKDLKEKLAYQLAENDNTIKRYKKEVENSKLFAITKFAKDLLDVRDNLERAQNHVVKVQSEQEEMKAEDYKDQVEQIKQGLEMTSSVMDSTFSRFQIVQFDPKGEKFDPNIHEAVFTLKDPKLENNVVAEVMQTGWKIGDRVLRASKVGINQK